MVGRFEFMSNSQQLRVISAVDTRLDARNGQKTMKASREAARENNTAPYHVHG